MIDYTQWKPKPAKVTGLLLDPENPRIPPTGQELSQDDLLAELIEHDRVYELAKSIAANGYYTDELLITTPRDGKLMVVEGNRRLAALKALLSPDSVPERHRKKFRALSNQVVKSMIKRVPVTVALSRDVALPRIAEKHTHTMLEDWRPAQKAGFYASRLDEGMTTDEICETYGLTRGQLDGFLRQATLYQMACSLDLPDEAQRKVENPRDFLLTNLERLMESQPGRDFLGVELDPKHVFRGTVPVGEFRKAFEKIVADVAERNVDSRVWHDNKRISDYLETIKDYRPDKSRGGSFTPKDIIKKPGRRPTATSARQPKGGPPRTSTRLIPPDLKCGVDSQRVHDVFNELRRLKVSEFPNAVAIMLRVLLELSVGHYVQRLGRTTELLSRYKQPHHRADWHPTLSQQLQFLLQETELPLEPLERRALTHFVSAQHTSFSLDSLDLFVHNKNVQPTEADLRAIWGKIEPLMRIVLSEPPQRKD